MSFEFHCELCDSYTIFKEIKGLTRIEKSCANCSVSFKVDDLVRFDRTDKDKLGILVPVDEPVDDRIKRLTDEIQDLYQRLEKVEALIYDCETEDADLSWWN